MNNPKRRFGSFLNQSFERFQKAPVPETESTWKQLLARHSDGLQGVFSNMDVAESEIARRTPFFARRPIWVAAGALAIIALAVSIAFLPISAAAKVASVEGGLHRVIGGEVQSLKVDDAIRMGDVIQAHGGSGGSLVLADSSRIEMRTKSEMILERAADGVRIQLHNGSIVVNAAKQREGHLYVQTKDLTVSVIGTVFLVSAEEEGSRVAVIEGEVHVEQGSIEQKLRSGEQIASNPLMAQPPVSQEIAWSRQVETHLATLQQNLEIILAQVNGTLELKIRPDTANRWESISIQSCSGPNTEAGARGGGAGASTGELRVTCMPLRYLLEMAYVKWQEPNAIRPRWFYPIAGGPGWIDTELYTIRAKANGQQDEQTLKGPMLQALLEDRFKLKMQRDVIEEQVYELRDAGFKPQPLVEGECEARAAKLEALAADKTDPLERLFAGSSIGLKPCGFQSVGMPRGASPLRSAEVSGGSMDLLIRNLNLDRIVLDHTGIKGIFDMKVTYSVLTSPMRDVYNLPANVVPAGDSIFTAMEQQLGLKLIPVKGPRVYYTIQYVERPPLN
jgi:uncharacterized protein (TIGR03435 family)